MSNAINFKLKILVCEADVRILKRLEAWVKAMGDDVFTCDNAIVANTIFNENRPDILLVSQNINGMGVIEFIENIKKSVPSQAIIMMLNSDIENNVFKRAIDLQVDKYLNIPVDPILLFNAIEALSQEKIWHEEYKNQERMLQDYKNAIDISFSVSKHDVNGKIFYVNDSFCKTMDQSYEDAMKGDINPLKNPNTDIKKVWNQLRKDRIYRDRQTFKFDNKKDHIVDVTAVAITNDKDEIEEFSVFSHDVTDVVNSARKIKEQEIEKKFQKLEHLKELDKVKDNFLTVFSHELKTPLNSIINFSDYIKKHLQKADFEKKDILVEQVSQIGTSGWMMHDMITNLIDSIKLKEDEIKLLKSRFELSDVIEKILEKYDNEIKDIKIIKSYRDECIIVNDEKRVEQLLSSLISNALKYCKNRVAITIKSNSENFIVEILDDGEGFADVTKVFELFEQSNEDSMTRTAQGTGVGLYVVKKLCNIMHYNINIGSSKILGGAKVMIKGKKDIEL
ncbi:MAG: ATP-binding protein [Campylobacterota bacterium]|nr:ATP-binding protein [Campylobacterota bacterium]